uniref:Uncharacterized protein n=1 Tax=Leersia perrieri TaxID=77586 RepID=A0A0D9WD77_9ORYZ
MASTNGKEEVYTKEGSKLYSKMMKSSSSEAAAPLAVPSFRVYYGVASAGSVPFMWESQPGTPKSSPSMAALPPLTPPPSYYAKKSVAGDGVASSRRRRRGGGGGWIGAVLFRRPWRRRTCSSEASSSSSMSPVFTVQQATPRSHHRRAFSGDADDAAAARCFGMERECERGLIKGCGVAKAVRNALSTVVGGRAGAAPATAAAAAY